MRMTMSLLAGSMEHLSLERERTTDGAMAICRWVSHGSAACRSRREQRRMAIRPVVKSLEKFEYTSNLALSNAQ